MASKDVVLIIEDSVAIGILLKEFLTKLSYSDIKITETGESGVITFRELVENKTPPLVFLDYNLPDSNAKSIMSQILTIKPDTKVIIETANSKDEDIIKEVIGLGAYHYIQKPIHFNDIKEIIEILEEDTISDTHSENIDDAYKLVDRHFNTYKRASIARLLEQSQLSENNLSNYIKKLKSEKNVSQLDNIRELCCSSCESLRLAQIFQCPSCKNSNFEQTKLIEHFDCGNFSEESTYADNKCPKCNKQIKALGVDYRVLNNRYRCKNCDDIFQDVHTEFLCLKCSNSFKLDDGNWKESLEYKLIQNY
jgi:response regulator of citrate/malate metabolism